ncbi:hypothetical protein BJV77DRAFT_990140 [Russula vinacea]|nr:hypothetical protein BJV77DRAFT_990140 [Russula vinacea]
MLRNVRIATFIGVSLIWTTDGAEHADPACLSPGQFQLRYIWLRHKTPIRHHCGRTSETWWILKAITRSLVWRRFRGIYISA